MDLAPPLIVDPRAGAPVRVERAVALIRIAVFAVAVVVLASADVDAARHGATAVLLGLTGAYAFACLAMAVVDETVRSWARVATLLVDAGLITLWIQATGGALSEVWSVYLVVIVSAALRFGMLGTIGVALALAAVHTWMLLASDRLTTTRLYRPTLLVVAGFAVGVLARQAAEQRRRRREAEAVAEARARELGRERAEVERLRRMDLARSEFVGVAAHEVRTPLAGILGVLATLGDEQGDLDPAERAEMIRGAESQAERLSRLVEDLLAVSRIDDGALRLLPSRVDPRDLVAEAVEASGAGDRVRLEAVTLAAVVCDADATIRVLANLLDNARKYAPAGSEIIVSIEAHGDGVRFAVGDAGPGIAPEDRERVFERFGRADATGKPGAGLGLYIARRLVRAQGGELEVSTSRLGGAELSFVLPQGAAEEGDDGRRAHEHAGPPSAVNHVTVPSATAR